MERAENTWTVWGLNDGTHKVKSLKPMLTPEGQVELLKGKGVTFNRRSEEQAIEALSGRDTFLHIAAFRKMFQRHTDGDNAGKYVSLDFADLLDMDELDAETRRCFLLASQDIERIVKTRLMERLSLTPGEDGYGILADFMQSQVKGYRASIERNLKGRIGKHGSADEYTGALIAHYSEAMPIWVFLEVVPFGTLLAFYLFCASRWDDRSMRMRHSMLTEVKAVRNCCSHGTCLINGLAEGKSSEYVTPHLVIEWLAGHGFKSGKSRRAKMGNRRTQQLVTCLVALDGVRGDASASTIEALVRLGGLLRDGAGHYGQENSFVSYLLFIAKVIDSMT